MIEAVMSIRLAALVTAFVIVGASCSASSPRPLSSPSSPTSSGLHLVAVAPMATPRAAQSSTRLNDGRVLVAGGCTDGGCNVGNPAGATAELFDPTNRTFKLTGRLHLSRDDHQAVLLTDGRVLIAGGWTSNGVTPTTEIYDTRTGIFTPGPNMLTRRAGFTAVALADGRVLLAGGQTAAHVDTATAEVFDPRAGTITAAGNMTIPRSAHASTLLGNGTVLVAGGTSNGIVVASAEVYDAQTRRFSAVGSMKTARYKAGSVTLADGRGFVVGGAAEVEARRPFTSTEIFDPTRASFTAGATMITGRYKLIDSIVRLAGGDVVVAGGSPRPEVYDSKARVFRPVNGTLGSTRLFLTATAIGDRRVLLVGGYDLHIEPTAQAWIIE